MIMLKITFCLGLPLDCECLSAPSLLSLLMTEICLNMIFNDCESRDHLRCRTIRNKSSCIFNLFISYPVDILEQHFGIGGSAALSLWFLQ